MKFEIFPPTVIHELGQRSNQEDSVFPEKGAAAETDRLFLVCDGMGGHAKGEVASANVIKAMTAWIRKRTLPDGMVTDSIIEDALQSAHDRLDTLDDGAENKMGTTLTMVCLHNGGVAMGHVGDSRIYHIRPSERKILYKSIDHSLVFELYRNGVISYEEMATSPQRNVITRAIMPGEENNDKIDITHTTNVKEGDYFYLCSDGMLEVMSDEQLVEVLSADSSDVMKASALVSMTEGNKDNHTALLIKIKKVIVEPGDESLPNDEHISPYNEVVALKPITEANRTAPIAAEPANAKAAQKKPQAATPVAPVTKNKNAAVERPKNGGEKKGINKMLLLLVILLFALVAGLLIYFLLIKNNSNEKSKSGESGKPSAENVQDDGSQRKGQKSIDGGGASDEVKYEDVEHKDETSDKRKENDKDKKDKPQPESASSDDSDDNHVTVEVPSNFRLPRNTPIVTPMPLPTRSPNTEKEPEKEPKKAPKKENNSTPLSF